MRLRRLELIRYGHFTDFSLDFGERSKNGPDLHIILGENEAGKSTAFNGYLDLLFGIEERSKYNFLHDYNALRIGALLEIGDRTLKLFRIKRRGLSLLNADDQPVDKEALPSVLHSLSRESYKMLFSLNDETLELGGEEILASKGDLGRLLFAGSAGIANLSQGLKLLRDRTSKLYAERSYTCEIASLKQELAQLDKERQSIDIHSSAYKRLQEALRLAQERYREVRHRRDTLRQTHLNLITLKQAYPLWEKLITLEKKLKTLHHLPDVPLCWFKEIKELQRRWVTAQEKSEEAQLDIDNSAEQLKSLSPDPAILAFEDLLTKAADSHSQAQAASELLPNVKKELSIIDSELTEIGHRLDANHRDELAKLTLSEDIIAHLDALLQQESQHALSLENAYREFTDAQESLQQAVDLKTRITSPDEKIRALCTLADRYPAGEASRCLDNAQKLLLEKSRKVERELKGHTREDIRSRILPSSSRAGRWQKKHQELQSLLAHQRSRQADYYARRAAHATRVDTMYIQLEGITDEKAVVVRRLRGEAWAEHRLQMNNATADAFEKALADDDHVTKERLSEARDLIEYRIAARELAEIDSVIETIVKEMRRIEEDLQGLREEMQPHLAQAGLPETFHPEELPCWVQSMQLMRELIADEDDARTTYDQTKLTYDQQLELYWEALIQAEGKPPQGSTLKELEIAARRLRNDAIIAEERHTSAINAAMQAEAQLLRRKRNLMQAEENINGWQTLWTKATDGLWLSHMGLNPIRTLLPSLRRLAPLLAKKTALLATLYEKERDSRHFHEIFDELIHSLGLEDEGLPTSQLKLLQERLKAAKKTEKMREEACICRAAAELKLKKALLELSYIEKRIQEMAAFFSCSCTGPDQLTLLLDQAGYKAQLIETVSEQERQLLLQLGNLTRAEVDDKFSTFNLQAVESELAALSSDLEEAERELEGRIAARQDAMRSIDAVGADGEAARLEERRRTLLLEIAKKSDYALSLHLGLMAADRALIAYRDRHRSDLLRETARAFTSITQGEFTSLSTQPGALSDQLIALRATGSSLAADQMSKGTRFQLYLALRLAGYRHFCKSAGPLPFIGDDIMETFDDRRTAAALKELYDISHDGQALYFTHHHHLCHIAKDLFGANVIIHRMPKSS